MKTSKSPRRFVQKYLKDHATTATELLNNPDHRDEICGANQSLEQPYGRDGIFDTLKDLRVKEKNAIIAGLLRVGPAHPIPLMEAWTGAADPVSMSIMEHFWWCVKRKMANMPVQPRPIMPMLFGKQYSGKTEAVKAQAKAILPDHLWISNIKLNALNDSANDLLFARKYIIFFDEMDGAGKVEIETLKARITADRINARVFYTQDGVSVPNLTTFIGASNYELETLIKDETGMTRFAQINTADKLDWDLINSLDYRAWFNGIDHNKPSPIVKYLDIVLNKSKALVRDPYQEWLEMGHGLPASAAMPVEVETNGVMVLRQCFQSRMLLDSYKKFIERQGFKIPTATMFGKKLREHGAIPTDFDRNSKGWILPDICQIDQQKKGEKTAAGLSNEPAATPFVGGKNQSKIPSAARLPEQPAALSTALECGFARTAAGSSLLFSNDYKGSVPSNPPQNNQPQSENGGDFPCFDSFRESNDTDLEYTPQSGHPAWGN